MNITQSNLSYKVEGDERASGVTSCAGLPTLIEACRAFGLSSDIDAGLGIRKAKNGYTETELSEAILALIASGGQHLTDMAPLATDPGLCALLDRLALPDARTLGRFLKGFHDENAVQMLGQGHAYIPQETAPLQRLGDILCKLNQRVQKLSPCKHATLDWDTQVIASAKAEALRTYKGFRGYQPAAIRWAEQGLVVNDQFRPGNVPSGFEITQLVKQTVEERLPSGIEKILFRGDSAAYDWSLMDYLNHRKEGAIRFAITADLCDQLRHQVEALPESAWRKLETDSVFGKIWNGDRWAEVEFVSNESARRFREPLRYIAVRHAVQEKLPVLNEGEQTLPGMQTEAARSRYHVVVCNYPLDELSGAEVIRWHRERCGSIERVFRVLNNDQAASHFPCGEYGANAAWYRYNVLLYNLLQAMRLQVLPAPLAKRELKGIRFSFFRLAGRVIRTGRRLILRIAADSQALAWILSIRGALQGVAMQLSQA